LIHILRNAVDHGIEDVSRRIGSGKKESATIKISATQTAAHVSICVSDDGQGLQRERIFNRAVEKGLIAPNSVLSENEIFDLIFLPGFSTAEKVTDLSGRGVGMDVVKRAVQDLGGRIEIQSEEGKGTTIQINLPSNLSIVDAIVVHLGKNRYAVPIQDIEEVVQTATMSQEKVGGNGRVINLRGHVLPLEQLSTFLPNNEVDDSNQLERVAIIAKKNSVSVAFEVDRIVGQQSIVVRQLDSKMKTIPGFSGGTILQDGEPGMIIHLPSILNQFENSLRNQEKQ
jgi:two-component system chemotaxis sensor kinase CheA